MWRPIETAPKSPTWILLGGMTSGPKVDTGHWCWTSYNRSRKEYNQGWTTSPGNEVFPTHWMPLPEPPEAD